MEIIITDEEVKLYSEFWKSDRIMRHGICGGPGDKGNYSINFRVEDGEKASYFFQHLLYDEKLREYLKEKAGFVVTSLNYYQSLDVAGIPDELRKIADKLDGKLV